MITTIQKSVYYFRYSAFEIFDINQFVIKLLIYSYVLQLTTSNVLHDFVLYIFHI